MDFLGDLLDGLFDIVQNALQAALGTFLGRVLYFLETALCKIVGMLDQMFQVFAGVTKVSYDGEKDYLINVFFNNHSISNVYWGMALIGIVMTFGFAIAAVTRKMFDSSGKMQTSIGQIVTAHIRSIFLILAMSAIMVVVLNSTNRLMQQINLIFSDPGNLDLEETIVYTDEDFAAMGRALKTIGNYAINPSYSSRYNLNTCFNEIRKDLYYLQQRKVFRYYYTTKDANGNTVNTWQSVLQKVANSHDLRTDLKLDVSYDSVTKALLEAMDVMRNDASFKPLQSYTRVVPADGTLPIDRYVFLMGTMKAAKNSEYNQNPDLTDPVRGPYYSGEKSIYNIDDVSSDFDIGFPTDYVVVYVSCVALIVDLVTIILNCIARIFNMLFLYLIAPPIFAVQPLDGGGKTKQWMTAFTVQAFSVFGTVISMRLLLILLPIVTSSKLVLFTNPLVNLFAKLVLIYGLFEVSKKATGLLTGILADSAGWQSIQAGDMSGSAGRLVGGVTGAAKAVAGGALKTTGRVAGKTANFLSKPVQNVAKNAWDKTGGRLASAYSNLGKGNVAKKEAMEQAQKSLAVDDAKNELMAKRAAKEGGGQPDLPANQAGADAAKQPPPLPGNQAGEGSRVPPAPSPPPAPGSLAGELAQKAAAHPRPNVDAQGNISTVPKAPPPPIRPAQAPGAAPKAPASQAPGSLAGELAQKAAAHPRPNVDAQGNISTVPKAPPPPPPIRPAQAPGAAPRAPSPPPKNT